MDAILSTLQSIPKLSFLNGPDAKYEHSASSTPNKQRAVKHSESPLRAKYQRKAEQCASELPSLRFDDFGECDCQIYDALVVRDRLRRRINANPTLYAQHGIEARSVPLRAEMESIRAVHASVRTVKELRAHANAQRSSSPTSVPTLSLITSFSSSSARSQ